MAALYSTTPWSNSYPSLHIDCPLTVAIVCLLYHQVAIDYLMQQGLAEHPEWYDGSGMDADHDGAPDSSDPRVAQAYLHSLGANGGGCMLPCGDLSGLDFEFDPGPV